MSSEELYRIVGETPAEYDRARTCIRETLGEAMVIGIRDPDRLAEVIMARLCHLEPPMLILSIEEVDAAAE